MDVQWPGQLDRAGALLSLMKLSSACSKKRGQMGEAAAETTSCPHSPPPHISNRAPCLQVDTRLLKLKNTRLCLSFC